MRRRLYSCPAKMVNQPWLFWVRIWMMRYEKGTDWRTRKSQNAPKANKSQGRSIPSGIISMQGWTGSSFSSSLSSSSSSILSIGDIFLWENSGLNMDKRVEVLTKDHSDKVVTWPCDLISYHTYPWFFDNIDHLMNSSYSSSNNTDYLTSGQFQVQKCIRILLKSWNEA